VALSSISSTVKKIEKKNKMLNQVTNEEDGTCWTYASSKGMSSCNGSTMQRWEASSLFKYLKHN
jgi:cytochrome c2